MAGYNRVIMVGNLTRDPDYKQLSSGQAVCTLGLASNRQYKSKQTGTMVQEVCFIDVDVFGPQAESCKQFLQKGRPVLIEGRLKFDSWETPEGQKRNKYSIVADRVIFLSSANNGLEIPTTESAERTEKSRIKVGGAKSVESAPDYDLESDLGQSTKNPEMTFKDEPPFVDDLPF